MPAAGTAILDTALHPGTVPHSISPLSHLLSLSLSMSPRMGGISITNVTDKIRKL